MPFSTSRLRLQSAVGLAAASFVIAGCSGGALSPDQARAATIAEVPGGVLTGATLERWLLKLPQPPSAISASVLVSAWMNTALAIDAVRNHRPLDDSATVDAAIAADADRGTSLQYFERRDAGQPPVTDAESDSLANIDQTRVFQQILLPVPPKADSATRAAAVASAQVLLKRAHDGANFAALAIEASPDSATRASQAFLPAITRDQLGRLPQRMQDIWNLKPGGISSLIGSSIGVHIMRRATRDEARPRLKQFLAPILAHHADSVFIDSIARAHHIEVAPDARPRMRAMAAEPVVAADSSPMASWQGGTLTPAAVRNATLMLDPASRVRLGNASDSAITRYLRDLATRQIVLGVIAPGPRPTPAARAVLAPAFRTAIAALDTALNHLPAALSAGDAAAESVDSALTGKRAIMLPGALAGVLRSRAKVRVNQDALQSVLRTVATEWRVQHANDSTATPAGTPRPPAPPP
ncbi:MAG TPA: peptidylprolyl isomerase [Gemmatimonadales bacterium]